MNKEISSDAFMDGFPYTLSESSQWIALAETISGQLALLCNDTEISTIIPNISRLSEDLLDAIAYDFSVDWYDVNGTLEEKRRTIQECIWYTATREPNMLLKQHCEVCTRMPP